MNYLKFFRGCYAPLKQSCGLQTFCSHGESNDCDHGVNKEQLPALKRKLTSFALRNTFSADKFKLRYGMAPDVTLAEAHMHNKNR